MKGGKLIRRGVPRFGGEAGRMLPRARLAGPMPWVMAIMVALTVMAAAAGLALANIAGNARAEIAGGVTVQIVEGAPFERDRQAALAVALLQNREGVASVRRVPDAELAELLEPWLGQTGDLPPEDAIPTPALIDVQLSGPVTDLRLQQLRSDLLASVPAARVDAQSGWLGPVFSSIRALQYLAIGLVLLLAITSAAAVWLAARSALGGNRDTIEVIHHLGGSDGQIARIFQRSIGIDALFGGIAGLALGLTAVFLLAGQFGSLGSGLLGGGEFTPVDWAVLALVPLAGVVLAMITARYTVVSALRRML